MNKIITVNGILVATQNDLSKHAENTVSHITEEERTAWNKKADAADLDSKVDTATFNTHQTDTAVHVTETEKENMEFRHDCSQPVRLPANRGL